MRPKFGNDILVALCRGLLPHGLQHRLHLLSFPEERSKLKTFMLKVLFDINDDISTINKDTTSFFSFEPNMLWILSNLTLMTTYPESTKPQLPSFPLSPTCNRYYLIACVQNGESICVSRGQGRVINTFNRSWRIK